MDDFDYTLFATSSALKYFNSGEEGHLARACPSRPVLDVLAAKPAASAVEPFAPTARSGSKASVVRCGGRPRCPGRSGNGVAGGGKME